MQTPALLQAIDCGRIVLGPIRRIERDCKQVRHKMIQSEKRSFGQTLLLPASKVDGFNLYQFSHLSRLIGKLGRLLQLRLVSRL